jgi:hypothetical protein
MRYVISYISCSLAILLSSLLFTTGCAQKLGITHLPDRTIDRKTPVVAFYMPETTLRVGKKTVIGWDRKLTDHFDYGRGEDYLLHIEQEHFDKRGVGIDPDYQYQVNLEIPAALFRSGAKIEPGLLRGFLVWGGRYSANRSNYCALAPNPDFVTSEEGVLRITNIAADKTVTATMNLYFHDAKTHELVRIFGKVTAPVKTRKELAREEAKAKQRLYQRAHDVNKEAWDPAQFRKKHINKF